MRNTEGQPQGGQRFGLRTGERPTSRGGVIAPERKKELAPPPTPEEKKAANAGEYAGNTKIVNKVGKNRLLKVALGGGAVVGAGAIAYETVPAFHQMVNDDFLSHLRGDQLVSTDTKPDAIFDNGADKIKVTQRNTVTLSLQEQAGQLGLDKENNTLTMTFPYDLPEGKSIILERATSNWQPTQELLEEVRAKGIKDDTVFKLPPNTTIKAPSFMKEEPAEYRAMLLRDQNDPNKIGSVRIFAYYPKENVTIVAWFFNLGMDPNKLHFEPMISMQEEDIDWSEEGWKKLPEIKLDTPLIKTITSQQVEMDLQVYRGQKVGIMLAGIQDKALSRVTPNFPTDSTGRLALTPLKSKP